jgi:hypothetical protein
MGLTGCPETSVRNYHEMLREIPDKGGFQVLCSFCQSLEFVPNTLVYVFPMSYLASHSALQFKTREDSQVLGYKTRSNLD